MVELKTPAEIAAMHAAGHVVAQALEATRRAARPGVLAVELDDIATKAISDAGAEPLFLGYHPNWAPYPFPGTICVSVNDAVVHGIPGQQRLVAGDLVSIDCGARLEGWCGDAAISFVVPDNDGSAAGDPADAALVTATDRALAAGIAAIRPGATLGDVGHAIGRVASQHSYGNLADHGGHGIGRAMHEDPFVPNRGRPGRGLRLRPGMVLALEPMFTRGGSGYRNDRDGWTVRTADASRAAHAEHTVAVTDDGPIILTAP